MFKKSYACFVVMLLIISGLLLVVVSCAEKTVAVKSEPAVTEADEDAEKMATEKKAQLEEQKLLEEKRLQEEAEQRNIAARNRFLSEDIHFDFDKAVILPEARQVLMEKAAWLKENSDVKVMIEGHCDERGTVEYNIALGMRRAQSAKACMIDLGIAASRMSTISYGEECPVDPGHNEEAWAKNRRAHFAIRD